MTPRAAHDRMTLRTALDARYAVCIVSVGARTPVGLSAPASAAAVRAAVSAIREHPHFVDRKGDPMRVAFDAVAPDELGGVDRLFELAVPALREALKPAPASDTPIALLLGLPEDRPGLPPNLVSELTRRIDALADGATRVKTAVVARGHSAGLAALDEACRRIQRRTVELILIGGVDSFLEPETLEWLDAQGQLASSSNRSGFPPGEAAGFCLLASTETARRLHLDVLAWIVGSATSIEEHPLRSDGVCIGKGLTEAIRGAIAPMRPDDRINGTICDINGERYRSEEFTFALTRTHLAFVDAHDFTTPTDCWGDVGAASGPLFAALAIAAGARGYAKGPRILLWAGAESGQRAAALLHLHVHRSGD
jgi:3-oxoacyl-[acyl-carrier-protein] synthase-1